MSHFICFTCIITLVLSCKKDDTNHDHEHDTAVPVVTITAPSEDQVFQNGDTIYIQGTVTDNGLHDGTVQIKDDTTGQVYFTTSPYVHNATSVPINYIWVSNVDHHAAVTLTATFNDHTPNTGTKVIHFTVLE